MNLNDDVVDRRLRLGPLYQLHPGRSCRLVRYDDCLHHPPPRVWYAAIFRIPSRTRKNTTAKLAGPMTCGYGIDAIKAARESQGASNAAGLVPAVATDGTRDTQSG
jgi:hypothetical protein